MELDVPGHIKLHPLILLFDDALAHGQVDRGQHYEVAIIVSLLLAPHFGALLFLDFFWNYPAIFVTLAAKLFHC